MHSITGNEETQQKRNLMPVNSVASHSPPPLSLQHHMKVHTGEQPYSCSVLSAQSPSLSQAPYNYT
jgi:hypothetical protein